MKRSALHDAFHFVTKLTARKIWNYIILRLSYCWSLMPGKVVHAGSPAYLSVEPTTTCNLRCPECPSGRRAMTRPQGKIERTLFKNIIEQVKGSLIYLMLYFQGEPLLHPQFWELVSVASRNNIYTATSTNAHHIDDDNARKMVESGLDRIIISMDGTDQETYEKYRMGGDLATAKLGIENVVKWKKKLRSSRPYIIIQFLVFKHNEHQVLEMKKICSELGADKLEFKSAQVYNYKNDTSLIPDNPQYSRYKQDSNGNWRLKKPLRNRCFRMWSGAVLTWDGFVVPCCFDKDAQHQFGKLGEQPFKEVWRSKAYDEFRKQILTDRSKINICANCTE